jgi:hypothetical protein
MRRRLLMAMAASGMSLGLAGAVSAQELPQSGGASTARLGIDSVTSADVYAGSDDHQGSAVFDVSAAWRIASHLQVSFRPVISRGLDGGWNTNVYQAAMRYDRPGPVRLRFEGGYLPSPIGILPLESRADQNPLVTSAQNYDAWLPFFERGTPWVQLTSGLYPLAVQVTAASEHWDLRGGVLGSSTARTRPLTGEDKPPAAPQLAIGGGVTPVMGLRLGASFERGVYAKAWELAAPATGDRQATIMGLDADYSVGFTRVYADWIQGVFDRAAGSTTGRALTVTGVRTLSPRWYLAARLQHESTTDALVRRPASDPLVGHPLTEPQTQVSVETVAGLRLTPELTVRAGYYGNRAFGQTDVESHGVCSIVWTQRWH